MASLRRPLTLRRPLSGVRFRLTEGVSAKTSVLIYLQPNKFDKKIFLRPLIMTGLCRD